MQRAFEGTHPPAAHRLGILLTRDDDLVVDAIDVRRAGIADEAIRLEVAFGVDGGGGAGEGSDVERVVRFTRQTGCRDEEGCE